jgi:putative NADH-flavin reductase
MKITVFGAAGRIGQQVLREGLRRGHQMTAFTRRPDGAFTATDQARLASVVHGDGRDPSAVRTAVSGADAVIAIVAASTRKGPHQAAEVLKVVTGEMASLGVRRLVFTSAYPIVGDRPRLPIALLRWVLAAAYADAAEAARIISATELDWTIAYLNRLTDKPATGRFRVSRELFSRPSSISRADAAAALLDAAENPALAKASINVSGA